MTIYLDTEFNGYKGELISLGMISSIDNDQFYGVIDKLHNGVIIPWVQQNVVPVLNIGDNNFVTYDIFRNRIREFLIKHISETIIADWPEDFKHLLDQLYEEEGKQLNLDIKFELIQSGECKPLTPHNALSDAIALMNWHQEFLKKAI